MAAEVLRCLFVIVTHNISLNPSVAWKNLAKWSSCDENVPLVSIPTSMRRDASHPRDVRAFVR